MNKRLYNMLRSKNPTVKEFLDDRGLYYSWVTALRFSDGEDRWANSTSSEALDLSMLWSSTPEGHEYWRNLNVEWRDCHEYETL